MGVFFVYILKSSACLIVFYLLYKLLFSRNTYHKENRVILLSVYMAAIIIPFVEIKVSEPATIHKIINRWEVVLIEQQYEVAESDFVPVMPETAPINAGFSNPLDWNQVILMLYCGGIIIFILYSICSLMRICLLLHNGRKTKIDKHAVLIIHTKNITPFSWMNYIVISQKDMDQNGDAILTHELAHVQHRHSWDLILADIIIFLQWFNPAAWLIKKELRDIHEYEADKTVLDSGVDAKEYQLLLIKKAVGSQHFNSMANSFNHSKLKKRITMMLKEKSSPWGKLMYLLMLPVGALVLSAFARPEISERFDEISKTEINDLASIIERKIVNKTPVANPLIVPNQISGKPKPSESLGDTVVQEGDSHQMKDIPVVIIDGYEVDYDKFLEMQPIPTESFYILNPKQAEALYGNRGKNGVYVYGTKPKKIDWDAIGFDNPMIIIDDEVVPFDEYLAMQPIKAKSMEFISPEEAMNQYGSRARSGVYKYTTKPLPYVVKTLQVNGIPVTVNSMKPLSVDMRLVDNIQVTDSTIVLNIYEDKSPQPNLIIKGNNLLIRKGNGMYINFRQGQNMENYPLVYKDKIITLEEFNKIPNLDFNVRLENSADMVEKYGEAAKNGVLLLNVWENSYQFSGNAIYLKNG